MLKFPSWFFTGALRAFLVIIISGCYYIRNDQAENSYIQTGSYLYNLNNPDSKYDLPEKLREISGMDYTGNGMIICINDEDGDLYYFDSSSGQISRKTDFGKSGDYEGVACKNDSTYVIRSDGKLYAFTSNNSSRVNSEKIDLPFNKHNNIEGICFYGNSLLLACKDDPEINDNQVEGRAVYRFDPATGVTGNTPFINLTTDAMLARLKDAGLNPPPHLPFKPSGIAVHPVTGSIFIIGSVGKLIIECDDTGRIKSIGSLNSDIFRQPEGICFDESGNLFISSEGRGGNGYILRFNYRLIED